jgi:signal transduction histidine kinase
MIGSVASDRSFCSDYFVMTNLKMDWKKWVEYFLPKDEEREPAFREDLSRLAVIGLRALGCISLLAPILVLALATIIRPDGLPQPFHWRTLALAAMGAFATLLSFVASVRLFARLLGTLFGYMIAMVLIISSVVISRSFPEEYHHLPGHITLVMLVGIAALPLKPFQTLAFGLSISASELAIMLTAPLLGPFPGWDPFHFINNLLVTFVCTGLTTVIYAQRSAAYRSRQQALRSFEELRRAQGRLLLSETAASLGRLAAALSHELNTPIGALSSAVETMVLLFKKRQQPDEAKLAGILDDLTHTALESCRRLKDLVARMQRFTNLDRAEEHAADINELLTDTVGLLQSELNPSAEVILDLKPLAPLKCRPQQLSAVFLNLLRNAIAHLREKGKIWVSTAQSNAGITIQVRDNGRGIPAERLASLFEPSFTVNEGRVTSSNWGLFVSRSIILEHGGQIRIDSTEQTGTTVTVTLPTAAGVAVR